MTRVKSPLDIARAAYKPKLPLALQGAVALKEGAATQSVANQQEIKALFPNTVCLY
jgi:pyrophosphate--fructose-6-phosphate 1-phosphotransferase